ncbi:MAG TPA: nuclear transport factor 2 family protein [Pyrinomonadaceae bacterium]|nr:nuclear transport factor 2 family protein [Pyrinomonadaceae bacterium]
MSEQDNQRVVQSVYEAFGRGDAAGVLAACAEEINWRFPPSEVVPYFGERRGHQGVIEFLTRIGGAVEFEEFEVRELIPAGDRVVALGRERGRVRATGKTFENEWAMFYTLRDGKVVELRSYEDTAAVADAFR